MRTHDICEFGHTMAYDYQTTGTFGYCTRCLRTHCDLFGCDYSEVTESTFGLTCKCRFCSNTQEKILLKWEPAKLLE